MDKPEIAAFLEEAGWKHARTVPLAGDASSRQYCRVSLPDGTRAVLMIAPPNLITSTEAFRRVGGWLSDHGFRTPKEFAYAPARGLLLMEDLGTEVMALSAQDGPAEEALLYEAATDILVRLHRMTPPPGLPSYREARMTDYALAAFDIYREGIASPAQVGEAEALRQALSAALDPLKSQPMKVTLRDYHAENLMVLRNGRAVELGLLDYQDAAYGFAAYDLVSLLQDARRDLAPGLEAAMISHYLSHADQDAAAFRLAYATCGAQRGLRLVLQFPMLALTHGKTRYLDMVPRVWRHLQRCLAAPGLRPLKAAIAAHIPEPTPDRLNQLRARAACAA